MKRKLAVVAVIVSALGAIALGHARRLRYAAVPLFADPSRPPPPRVALAVAAPLPLDAVTAVPARPTAILERPEGVLVIATFDAGLYRYDARADRQPKPWAELNGRERFVDALLPLGDAIVAGTHRGAIVLGADGTRRETWAPGETVTSLISVGGEPLVGTTHGLYRRGQRLDVRGPDGAPIRVTALATAAGRLYLGSPAGLYSLPLPLSQAETAEWQPLVFGSPGARSNVVTALAPLGDGVLAGTDDAGVAFAGARGVRALAFDAAGADDVNPGAMAIAGGAVVVGTQGGGLMRVTLADGAPSASRPRGWQLPRVSAVADRFIAADDGRVFAVARPARDG